MLGAGYVEYIHDEVVSRIWAGSDPTSKGELRDRGLLESALGRPFQSVFGEDAYPDVHQKATALFHSLIANHPFSDGNKRTAVLALYDFLLANGEVALFSIGEMYEIAIRMASYRERASSHAESFDETLASVRGLTISISQFEALVIHGGADVGPYDLARRMRETIRKNPRNTLIEPDSK
jgi:death-on-curing family protein